MKYRTVDYQGAKLDEKNKKGLVIFALRIALIYLRRQIGLMAIDGKGAFRVEHHIPSILN